MIRISATDKNGQTATYRTNDSLFGLFAGPDNRQLNCRQYRSIDDVKNTVRALAHIEGLRGRLRWDIIR